VKKKTAPTQFTYSDSVKLFRDDIEDIIKILSDKCERLTIEDNEFVYDSLDEVLDKRGPYPRQPSITGFEPYVSLKIRIKRSRTTLDTSGDGDNLAPFFFIQDIFRRRRRVAHLVALTSPFLLLMLAAVVVTFTHEAELERLSGLAKGGYFMTPILILYVLTVSHGLGAFSVISLKKKHEEESFWSRNKDTVWVGVIVAVFTALITYFITYLTSR
jgi:hypothetical protein